ncbi:CoA-binding protein [Natrinema soli]|uniref:acetate--CoA ligase (ADP-forming) n=1 Tax=Natrinema soli TaxID=1930624 RepID=A0ABD5SPE5_9EURY|nr:CoA-binding protein [Natrinema soli]
MNLRRLFRPECIAVIGASRTEGKLGYEAMANAVAFDGPVYPVNPSAEGSVLGEPSEASVTDIDERVDLALLAVPAPVVPEVLAECGEANVGGAIIYSGGFAEAGEDGKALQTEVTEVADKYGIALLGPNTSGFVAPAQNLFTSFAGGVESIEPGGVTILAQSGGVAHQLAFSAHREGRGISTMVGLGNRANVGFEETVRYFDDDPQTDAIVLHVEGTDTGRALVETCCDADTPVAAYKVGKADVGDFAESHTGALTGDHDLYTAGFAQYGVSTVDSTTELLDAGVALADAPSPDGPNVGVVTAQAGPGIAITDRLKAADAEFPTLTDETQEAVEEILPGMTYSANPVDTGRPMPEFGDVVAAVARDENVDVVMVYELYERALGYPTEGLEGLVDEVDKPIVFATGGPDAVLADELAGLESLDIPTFRTPERGADAVAALVQDALRNADPDAAEAEEVSR